MNPALSEHVRRRDKPELDAHTDMMARNTKQKLHVLLKRFETVISTVANKMKLVYFFRLPTRYKYFHLTSHLIVRI